jgi:diadenosine tetraphosphate (Ap4A) HIT family hydrolase
MSFTLHPTLAADSLLLGHTPLCQLRLQNNALFPWVVLVPQREACVEIFDLSAEDQTQLMTETSALASTMKTLFSADKMNIATLGNIVPQLHVHIIARFTEDTAWPKPVWGNGHEPYTAQALGNAAAHLKKAFAHIAGFVSVEDHHHSE